MLKLKNYSFSGIGRFVEKQTIDLESRNHLIQIDGENTNTGGSSGAGKSTTVEALAFLLGISDIPSTHLQSRITKSPIWVQGEFEGGVTVTRSKKDGLTIETPEETVSGNSKLAEEKLDEIIGVDRNLLKTMCYKRQKQGGFFLNLTPKQSHQFLVQCLDLGIFQDKVYKLEDILKNKYKPRKIELESAKQVLLENISNLGTLLEQKIKPEKPDLENKDYKQTELQVLVQRLERETLTYDEMVESLGSKPEEPDVSIDEFLLEEIRSVKDQVSELKQIMHNNIVAKETSIKQAASAIVNINEKIRQARQSQDEMIRIKEQTDSLLEQRKHITDGNCPTCLREWDNESKKDKLKKIDISIENQKCAFQLHRKEIEKIPHYKIMQQKAEELLEQNRNLTINLLEEKDLQELLEKLRVLENKKDNFTNEIKTDYLKQSNEWHGRFSFIDSNYQKTKTEIKDKISEVKSTIEKIEFKEKSYEEALKTFKIDCNNIIDARNNATGRLKNTQEEIEKIEKQILLSEESVRLIKNFTLQKFQDTLEYIGARATEIINMIPNMSNAVIYFENAKETKSGKIKNEVNAIINLEGDTAIPIKTLSGGERTSADFAIDLAVGEMIESMTQKGVNFFIIDEGFDGLDSISKIECLEILKNLNTDKKIMMVDHSSEVKEMIHDIIKVKRVGEESFIQ